MIYFAFGFTNLRMMTEFGECDKNGFLIEWFISDEFHNSTSASDCKVFLADDSSVFHWWKMPNFLQ